MSRKVYRIDCYITPPNSERTLVSQYSLPAIGPVQAIEKVVQMLRDEGATGSALLSAENQDDAHDTAERKVSAL